jgi:hypothetical protein
MPRPRRAPRPRRPDPNLLDGDEDAVWLAALDFCRSSGKPWPPWIFPPPPEDWHGWRGSWRPVHWRPVEG